jgi:hypothetical protein
VHPAAVRLAYKTHPDGLVLVTDAISAAEVQDNLEETIEGPEGWKGTQKTYLVGKQRITRKSANEVFLEGTSCIAGRYGVLFIYLISKLSISGETDIRNLTR